MTVFLNFFDFFNISMHDCCLNQIPIKDLHQYLVGLEEKKILNNKKFQIKIKKNIPQEAGLGGGSMNAATILNFLIEKNFIKINQKKILQITKLIGSDVILGINPKNTILSSNGAIKKFLKTKWNKQVNEAWRMNLEGVKIN